MPKKYYIPDTATITTDTGKQINLADIEEAIKVFTEMPTPITEIKIMANPYLPEGIIVVGKQLFSALTGEEVD